MTIASGADLTKYNEGCRLAAYFDPIGNCWTIGYGHVGPDSGEGFIWTQAQCDNQFVIDYARARIAAQHALGVEEWAALDECRQAVLCDMAYELGAAGLGKFINFLAACRSHNWILAGTALKNSLLFREVPTRENRNLAILLTGQWPGIEADRIVPRSVALPPAPTITRTQLDAPEPASWWRAIARRLGWAHE